MVRLSISVVAVSFYDPPPIPIGRQFLLDAAPYFLITFFYYYVSPPIPIGRQFLLDTNSYWTPISIGRSPLFSHYVLLLLRFTSNSYWAPVSIGCQFLLDAAPYFCHYHCDTTQRVDCR